MNEILEGGPIHLQRQTNLIAGRFHCGTGDNLCRQLRVQGGVIAGGLPSSCLASSGPCFPCASRTSCCSRRISRRLYGRGGRRKGLVQAQQNTLPPPAAAQSRGHCYCVGWVLCGVWRVREGDGEVETMTSGTQITRTRAVMAASPPG